MNIDASYSFSSIISFLVNVFKTVLSWLQGIHLAGDFSLFDLWIAFSVFSLMFTLLFTVVRSGVNNSYNTKAERARSERRVAARSNNNSGGK